MAPPAAAQWSRCVSDIDTLQTAAEHANDAARDANSTERARWQRERELSQCEQVPAVNDFRSRGCMEQRTAYQGAEMRYAASFENAREALDAVASAVQAVELSCEFPMAAMIPVLGQPEPARTPACESFLRRRLGVPLDSLRVICTGEMTDEECRACLGDPRN